MHTVLPGEICPETGTWVPTHNPIFYPEDYADKVMKQHFSQGDVMPATPHGEPSWALQKKSQSQPVENFTGLSAEEIIAKLAAQIKG